MKVEAGKTVKLDYELAVDGGEILESSEQKGPLEYEHGAGRMLPGLEARLEGAQVDEERSGVIPAAEAYGTEKDQPTRVVGRKEFPKGADVARGKLFEAKDQSGNPVKFTVLEVLGDQVTVRFLHPLAGKDIRFKAKVLAIT